MDRSGDSRLALTRKLVAGLALGATLGLGALAFSAWRPDSPPQFEDPYSRLRIFGQVFAIVMDRYVDRPDEPKLVAAAIEGMVNDLDPHSSYVDGKSYVALQSITNGEFGDVGVELTVRNGLITVITPIDGTSAARAGIRPGDVLTRIDGHTTQGMTLDRVREKIRGEPNTSVRLTVTRGPGREVLNVDLARDLIKIKSVRSRLETGGIGYIRIAQFTENTGDGLRAAMAKLRAEVAPAELEGYILDLRNNPGGFIDQAIETVNAFIDEGEIVSTRGRGPGTNRIFSARPGLNVSGGKPVVVLINGASASASEIVAGALQDLGRATIIGTRSFGKGTAQTTLPLGADGALRLTTALFFTPSGRSIQAAGVRPDIEVLQNIPGGPEGRYRTSGEASLRRHLAGFETEAFGSQAYIPPDPEQDTQLRVAEETLLGPKRPVDRR